jgi:hypothetical protein
MIVLDRKGNRFRGVRAACDKSFALSAYSMLIGSFSRDEPSFLAAHSDPNLIGLTFSTTSRRSESRECENIAEGDVGFGFAAHRRWLCRQLRSRDTTAGRGEKIETHSYSFATR